MTTTGPADERRRRVEAGLRLEPVTDPRAAGDVPIAEAMPRYAVPGASLAVIAGGEIAWAAGYGLAAADAATPVGPETIFQACSISKPVAALAALRLVQEGRLHLDDDVNERLTSWRVPANGAWQPRVTLRHLLTHSAGLTYTWYPGYGRASTLPTLLQTLRGEAPATTPPVRVTALPGTLYRYSGSHFSVLQQLLVDVVGRPFPALMRDLVFEPLGLRHSGYETDFPERHAGATAAGHDAGGRPIDGGWRRLPEGAGAGLWTTPSDLARLALEVQAAATGRPARLLEQATARAMLTPHLGGRGLGWEVEGEGETLRFGHGGSNIGYRCWLVAAADGDWGAAVMTNGDEGHRLVEGLIRAVGRAYDWPGLRLADDLGLVGQAAAEPAPSAAGEYRLADGPTLTVTADGAGLLLAVEGQPPLPLTRAGGAVYVAEAVDAVVAFARSPAGEISDLTLRQRGQSVTAERIG